MRAFFTFLVVSTLLLLCSGTLPAAAEEGASTGAAGRLDQPLLGEILRAVGKGDPESLLRYESALRRALEEIERRAGHSRSSYRTARRIHGILHETFLRRYEVGADGIDAILDRGEYNCVSASLFYGIVARAFGMEAEVLEIPRHVYVRLNTGGRLVEIESTSRIGFDLRQHLDPAQRAHPAEELPAESLGTAGGEPGGQRSVVPDPARVVALESAVSFVWYNTGRRELDQGNALRAAASFRMAARLQPELASGSGTLAGLMARAFRIDYEEGRFDLAYRIAEMDMEMFPGTTSGRDRLLAAAAKRISAACDAGSPAGAEEILRQAAETVRFRSDQIRLDRGACPQIAAAAVRVGDWDRAARMVALYSATEPDRVESTRLARWVMSREQEASRELGQKACADLAPGLLFEPAPGGNLIGNASHTPGQGPEAPPQDSSAFGRAPGQEPPPLR